MAEEIGVAGAKLWERPLGLAVFAGALGDEWDTIEQDMEVVVAARRQTADRQLADLD